ncbi:SPW repeat protein [Streptomyces sp. NPDC060000]|uniref:SPW repeat domain-containing protein n=1 Tax=Streptomyces sp. NPDC060000 TaxID=3347031 RepID=UPI0036CD0E3E
MSGPHEGGARSDFLVLAAGAWLAASPYLLSLQNTAVLDGARIVDMVIGGIYILLALASLLMLKRTRGHRDHSPQAPRDRG